MRIFLDANILFSAARNDGAVRELLRRLTKAGHACCADGYVIEEARRNLALKAPHGLDTLAELLDSLDIGATVQNALPIDAMRSIPAKDRPVLAAAIHMRCAALVSGDRTHFGAHYGKRLGGVTIHSPRSLFDALLA